MHPPQAKRFTHCDSRRGKKTAEFRCWMNMRNRCQNPKNPCYNRYGGRGIEVCAEWDRSFVNFLSDMGRRPSPLHTLDRIDSNGNYEPGNCRWETRLVQSNNRSFARSIAHNGKTCSAAEWARITGLRAGTIIRRLNLGWSVEKTLTQPTKSNV